MYNKGHNYKARRNRNLTEQQQQNKKTEEHKNLHQKRNKWRDNNRGGHHQTRTRRGGGHSEYRDGKQDGQVKHTRFMTEEFKKTNAMLLEGRLVCRHFLWGRCIKADECQLEHIEGYNDMIKEACKFYIQGFCTKGESCPYMHKSFPCKFFHTRGKCSQGTECKFSHDPLNEVTKQLMDELLKREKDLQELTKKAEEEAQGQPADTEQNLSPDTLIQALRPSFYNSGEVNTEQEASSCQTEQLSAVIETAVSHQASDSGPPHSPLSTNLTHKEPVCYSVEAMLRPQLFKPFPSLFTSPGNQEPTHPSVAHTSDCTSGSAAHSEDPLNSDYAVRSVKSTGSHTFGHIATPPTARTVSNALKIDYEELSGPLVQRNEVNKPQYKMLHSKSSFQVHTDQIPKTHSNLTLASEDHKKLGGEMPASLKFSHEVKLHPAATGAESSVLPKRKGGTHLLVNYKCEGSLPFLPTGGRNPTLTPKHPSRPKSHLSGCTSKSQTLVKPPCPSAGFSESRAAVPAEPVTSSAKTSDSGKSDSQTTTESNSKMTCGGQIQKSPFYSLFESPISDARKPTPDIIKSPCPAPQTARHRSKDEDVKTDKALAFHSLFAAPLSISPHPPQPDHSNRSPDTTHSSVSEQRAGTLETRCPPRFKTSHRPTFPKFSQSPNIKMKMLYLNL
ncbi:hypothetical protein INR49_031135 [Caranx melampygus]|nr:hypothetical protein INR49_031135 [Caranx melampygus]